MSETMKYALIALGIFVALLIIFFIFRKLFSNKTNSASHHQEHRLSIIDALPIDQTRQLVLVKRDQTEHLIMIGGSSDLLIENNISATQARLNTTTNAPHINEQAPKMQSAPAISPMPPATAPQAATATTTAQTKATPAPIAPTAAKTEPKLNKEPASPSTSAQQHDVVKSNAKAKQTSDTQAASPAKAAVVTTAISNSSATPPAASAPAQASSPAPTSAPISAPISAQVSSQAATPNNTSANKSDAPHSGNSTKSFADSISAPSTEKKETINETDGVSLSAEDISSLETDLEKNMSLDMEKLINVPEQGNSEQGASEQAKSEQAKSEQNAPSIKLSSTQELEKELPKVEAEVENTSSENTLKQDMDKLLSELTAKK